MSEINQHFLDFSKPFIDALKETFSVMMQDEISIHSPSIKTSLMTTGEITSLIGMNGTLTKDDNDQRDFRGQIVISFSEDVYIKVASAMLMEEYTEYCDDISDTGAEIINIVMGNAKASLAPKGYSIGMATPSTIRGKDVEVKYISGTTTIETKIDSSFGSFTLEICYNEC